MQAVVKVADFLLDSKETVLFILVQSGFWKTF